MKITLRKANALQNNIQEAIRKTDLVTEISITEFENRSKVLELAQFELGVNLKRKIDLTRVLYEIRAKVGDANRQADIDRNLTEIARLDRESDIYEGLASASVKLDDAVIAGQLDKIRNASADVRVYGRDTVTTSILTKEQIAVFRDLAQQNKRSKQHLQDAILEMNVKTEIELSNESVKILQDAGLL